MRSVKKFQLKEGSLPDRPHPALKLLDIWMLTDPEGEPVMGFIELHGHWCDAACGRGGTHHPTDFDVSVNVETIDVIESHKQHMLFWISSREIPLRVLVAAPAQHVQEVPSSSSNEVP